MAILVGKDTRILVQGITGKEGAFHAEQCNLYGRNVVAGVSPGKAGVAVHDIPVYNTVKQAVGETNADCSLIFVPPAAGADAIVESLDAGIELLVCITEGIPVRDMMMVKYYMTNNYPHAKLIGPNCPGLITPDEAKVGILPGRIFSRGKVGIISRSGTLTYEAAFQLTRCNIGQSTAVGIGGDPVHGLSYLNVLEMFQNDPETEAVLMIGEIGGTEEEEAAQYISKSMTKAVFAYIAGVTAPQGKRMGHAGAIVTGGKETADYKVKLLGNAGVRLINNAAFFGDVIKETLAG